MLLDRAGDLPVNAILANDGHPALGPWRLAPDLLGPLAVLPRCEPEFARPVALGTRQRDDAVDRDDCPAWRAIGPLPGAALQATEGGHAPGDVGQAAGAAESLVKPLGVALALAKGAW